MSSHEPPRAVIAGPGAVVAGFLTVVPANAVASRLRKGSGEMGVGTWLLAQASGAGHLLTCGLLSALVLLLWLRFRPARIARLDLAALGLLAAALGALAVGPDFGNFVVRVEAARGVPPELLGAVAGAIAIVGCVVAVRPIARRWPWLALALGVALAFANNFLLELDYPGIHLLLGGCGALASTLGFMRLDLAPLRASRRLAIVAAVLAPIALGSLLVRPSEAAWRKLLETPGAFAAPFVSELVPDLRGDGDGDGDDPGEPASAQTAAGPRPPSGLSPLPPDGIVILLICDALRADVVDRRAPQLPMPNLDRLREHAVEFTMARSAASTTHASISSLFTGKYYSALRAARRSRDKDEEGDNTADASPRVAELLAPGVKNFHVVPTRLLLPRQGATRGFDSVKVADKAPSRDVLPKVKERFARGVDGPFLLYMHWMDAHAPYDLDGTQGTPKEAYLREVAILDQRLGELLDWLDDSGFARRTTIILGADHGEAFGEHGIYEHGKAVYEELLRVPLLIAAPGRPPRVIDAPVSTIDLGATILDLFGRPVPAHFMGESLLPLAYGDATAVRHPIAAEASYKARAFYSTQEIKVIFDRLRKTTEVYDLAADPGEKRNLADSPAVAKHIARARRFWKAQVPRKEASEATKKAGR